MRHTARTTSRMELLEDVNTNRTDRWFGFRDRIDAGHQLGDALAAYKDQDVLVLGIPRGGVPVAAEVARRIGAELDVVVARKLGAPDQRELAMGAVTANGGRFINEDIVSALAIPQADLEQITMAERQEAQRREARFRRGRPAPRVSGRTVIVIDDGLATGATMIASVRSVRLRGPSRLVVAVPVGSREACATLQAEADEVVCLHQPALFWAVGQWYEDFQPTTDEEVEHVLQEAQALHRVASQA